MHNKLEILNSYMLSALVLLFTSCDPKEGVGGKAAGGQSSSDGIPVGGDSRIPPDLPGTGPDTGGVTGASPPDSAPARPNSNQSNAVPRVGIVAQKRTISPGDDFLKSLAQGGSSVPLLEAKDVKDVDLNVIWKKATPVTTHRHEASVVDHHHAYARVLDTNISLAHHIVCRGVFEYGENYLIVYDSEKNVPKRPESVYVIRKDNGRIFRYYEPLK